MNGPSLGFLQQLNQQLNPNVPANEYPSIAELANMPPPQQLPVMPAAMQQPPTAPAAPPPAQNMSLPTDDPNALMSRPPPVLSQGPAPSVPVGVEPEPPPPQVPPDVRFLPVGGGATPAREQYMRGPQQNEHLLSSFEPPQEAAQRVDFRNQIMADRAEAEYQRQAEAALARQDAAERVLTRRQFEQQQMMMDYQDQIQKLGQMHLDQDRWWARMGTGEKIATTILTFIGGLAGAGGNGQNLVYNHVLREIDNDLAAQKFDYQTQLDQAKGTQNAYGMMLERYGTEDAAMAAARASALDYASAKASQIQAQYGGAESANARDQLVGQLQAEKEKTIAAGFKFIPPGIQPGKYKMVVRGQEIPGFVDEKKAQEIALEHGVKPAEGIDKAMVEGGIQSSLQQQKLAAEQAAKGKEHAVVMPNGETVYAPSEPEAKEIRDLSTSATQIKRLVAEAKQIREKSVVGVPLKFEASNRLRQIQKDLITQFAVQNKLGALSKEDLDLAIGGTADLFQLSNGVEARLDRLNESATAKVQARAATYAGAKDTAPKTTGQLPKSLTFHGK